ncbi:triose-phosphate isomerase [Bacteroidota bacterium]
MRKTIIAGNWKMNNNLTESITLLSDILKKFKPSDSIDVIICPPFTFLETANALLKDSKIKLGAQNVHFEDSGAFTGEISAKMLLSVGCEYVIIGHSERRALFSETNSTINKKIHRSLFSNLKVIFCVGETIEEREKDLTNDVIKKQITEGLKNIQENDFQNIIIAYEPVWAIGTGKTATLQQAQSVHRFIRELIAELYSNTSAQKLIIQYGGSVKPENSRELLKEEDIDGALIGGACLKADSFIEIINSVSI